MAAIEAGPVLVTLKSTMPIRMAGIHTTEMSAVAISNDLFTSTPAVRCGLNSGPLSTA